MPVRSLKRAIKFSEHSHWLLYKTMATPAIIRAMAPTYPGRRYVTYPPPQAGTLDRLCKLTMEQHCKANGWFMEPMVCEVTKGRTRMRPKLQLPFRDSFLGTLLSHWCHGMHQ